MTIQQDKKSLRGKNWDIQCAQMSGDILSTLGKQRGIEDLQAFTELSFERDLIDPVLLPDAEKSVERIIRAIEEKEPIMIFGDYDADGITATAILVDMLDRLGADVSYRLPHRINDGYGFKMHIAEVAAKNGIKLIITADCGVSNADSIAYANEQEMDVIVTDHHTVPEVLPPAFAIVHPKVPASNYPYKGLCGAGVAYKLCHLLGHHYLDKKELEKWIKWNLDLVAIGTVADCSDLLGENRVLVAFGLKVLPKTKRIGLRHLYALSGLEEHAEWNTMTIGYRVAPRLNAVGRLDDPEVALQLLLTKDDKEAQTLAQYLHGINTQRQELTEKYYKKAFDKVSGTEAKLISLYDPEIPPGIVGLIAGRLSTALNMPAVIMTRVNDKIVGSIRSIDVINIMDHLPEAGEYLDEFGGHSQAAGFSLLPEKLEDFQRVFSTHVTEAMNKHDTTKKVSINCVVRFDEISKTFVADINKLRPYGIRNEKPVFMSAGVSLEMVRIVGKTGKHLKCTLRQGDITFGSILFNAEDIMDKIDHSKKYDIVYTIERNTWNGATRVEMQMIDMRLEG